MARRGHRGRVDSNHEEIRDMARQCGFLAESLAPLGRGVPDLLLLHVSSQQLVLGEVKRDDGRLTADQVGWHERWPVVILRTPEDVIALGKRLAARHGAV